MLKKNDINTANLETKLDILKICDIREKPKDVARELRKNVLRVIENRDTNKITEI